MVHVALPVPCDPVTNELLMKNKNKQNPILLWDGVNRFWTRPKWNVNQSLQFEGLFEVDGHKLSSADVGGPVTRSFCQSLWRLQLCVNNFFGSWFLLFIWFNLKGNGYCEVRFSHLTSLPCSWSLWNHWTWQAQGIVILFGGESLLRGAQMLNGLFYFVEELPLKWTSPLCDIPLYRYLWETTSRERRNLLTIFERFLKVSVSITSFLLRYLGLSLFVYCHSFLEVL